MKYTIKEAKQWDGDPGRDGKYMFTLVFEEEPSEMYDYRSLRLPEEGTILTGKGQDYTTKGGSVRRKFIETEPFGLSETDARITASWAVGLAVQHAADHTNKEEVEALAEMYFDTSVGLAERKYDK